MLLFKTRGYGLKLFFFIAITCSMHKVSAQENDIKSLIFSNPNQVFTAVETEPVPAGGMNAFYRFLSKKIHYPSFDKIFNIQGRVVVQFVIEKDGSLTELKVISSPSTTLGDETMRVLKMSPNWTPGLQNKKPVRVQYTIPVNFSLGDGENRDFVQLLKYLNSAANYPDVVKSNKSPGLIVAEINVTKKHINKVQINKGISDDLNQAVSNIVQSYADDISTRNGPYTFIFKMGDEPIDTSSLNGYVRANNVAGIIQIPLATK